MTSEHFDQRIDALVRRQPYQPFTVELNGGEQFEVDHPRAIVVRDGTAVYVKPGGVSVWFDHDSVNQIIGDIANKTVEE